MANQWISESQHDKTIPIAVRTFDTSAATSRLKRWSIRFAGGSILVLLIAAGIGGYWFFSRYDFSDRMSVDIVEYTTFEYPESPGEPSTHQGNYDGRRLELIQKDDNTFDFVFHPAENHVAKIVFRDIDASLVTPGVPEYVRDDNDLSVIAMVDREWNRQQVQFPIPSPHVEITGGDGFEEQEVVQASLAKNCLNAGLWEVILYEGSSGDKRAYYHGWFTFPMGQYKRLWEQNTGLSYWKNWNWYRMEHWLDPAGTVVSLDGLRSVKSETQISTDYNPNETIIVGGEQIAKKRTLRATNVNTWSDFNKRANRVRFASFVPPGYYDVETPWENEYWRIAEFKNAIVRDVDSANGQQGLHELELVFTSDRNDRPNAPVTHRFFVGGIDLATIPRLATSDYKQGLYMPMGIGVPPFYQTYDELVSNPPLSSSFYSFLLDGEDRWIDHHSTAIDGPVMHWDDSDPRILHLYFLSYERHSLVRHFEIKFEEPVVPGVDAVAAAKRAEKR